MVSHKTNKRCGTRSAFTLVEMLVSVALVLLMMSMFAAVFQIATGSIQTQQANAENDRKARALQTMFKNDFAKMTFRNVQPFFQGETPATSLIGFGDREGYLYINTNNPDDFSDDLIQLTVTSQRTDENSDLTPYFGRATSLVDPVSGNSVLTASPNQPELDDADLSANSTGSSSAAEICYFIRNGNLYRRQVLIREPLPVAGLELDPQPTSFSAVDFFAGFDDPTDMAGSFNGKFRLSGGAISDDFYRYFDYAARRQATSFAPAAGDPQTAAFIGLEALSNTGSVAGNGPILSFGIPSNRFGFDPTDGLSREHLRSVPAGATGTAEGFMGRFLQAETSAANFNWPQQLSKVEGSDTVILKGGNPLDLDNAAGATPADFALNQYGIITDFDNSLSPLVGRGGPRRQEDLLMANVHEMKIEIFDARLGQFVVPGYGTYSGGVPAGLNGDYHLGRCLNTTFHADNGRVGAAFDTWHPDNLLSPVAGQMAPYEPYRFTPPHVADQGRTPAGIPLETSNKGWWAANTEYDVGDVVFPFEDANGANWDPTPPASESPTLPNGVFDLHPNSEDGAHAAWGFNRVFRCVGTTNGTISGNSGATQPEWLQTDGRRTADNEVFWESIDNSQPLTAVRITIRFRNEKSSLMRQLSMVLSTASNQ